ncbi:hypothetical protein Clacol_003270 [Clathrus columnatus]|uniref:Glucose-methanol-choline oxidoreductase N-terminal domain-containing protein n=1 Tax=Clathrus columnatus TaxID=1419009 RepID=A0AAV5A6E3_9AGAM|nr:hypothetical protein Clacol_003270 [Clathrus columnatus]
MSASKCYFGSNFEILKLDMIYRNCDGVRCLGLSSSGRVVDASRSVLARNDIDWLTDKGYMSLKDPFHSRFGWTTIRNPLGEYTGLWNCPPTVAPEKLERTTAFKGYIQPNFHRKNLFVLLEAHVTKLIWKHDSKPHKNGKLIAEGVEFIFRGETFITRSAKEVLLTAGTLKSPQILELGGTGRLDVLKPLGIPRAGGNLQDHYSADVITFGFGESHCEYGFYFKRIEELQLERFKDLRLPAVEIMTVAEFLDYSNPLESPQFDANALEFPFELDILTEEFKFARKLRDCEPLKSIIAKEIAPGDKVVTDEQIHGEIANIFSGKTY